MENGKRIFLRKIKRIVGITFAVVLFLAVLRWGYYYLEYVRSREIRISSFGKMESEIIIPVRYHDGNLTTIRGVAMYTPDRKCYHLRCVPEKDILWITVNRVGWGGVTVFTARYAVSDAAIRARLFEMWKKAVADSGVSNGALSDKSDKSDQSDKSDKSDIIGAPHG